MAELLTRGCERRSDLLETRQRMTLRQYRELGILRDEFLGAVNWNNYDIVMKLRPRTEIDENGKKIERANNNPFIKGFSNF